MKIYVLFYDSLFSVGSLLYQIVRFDIESDNFCQKEILFFLFSSLGWQLYMEYYEREFPSLFLGSVHHSGVHAESEGDQEEMDEGHVTAPRGVAIPLHPPSLVHWLDQKLRGKQVREREKQDNHGRSSHCFLIHFIAASAFPCAAYCVQENSHFVEGTYSTITISFLELMFTIGLGINNNRCSSY